MTPELEKYYSERLSMMGSQGWADLMDDIEDMIKATDTLNGVADEKALNFKKGELSIMNWLKNLKEMRKEAFEGLKNESQ